MSITYLNNKKALRIFFVISLMIFLFILADATGFREKITITYIKNLFFEHKLIGSILFILLFAIGNTLYIPGWLFLVGAILAVGKWYAGPLAFLGGVGSSVLSYFLVGLLGKDALRALEKQKYARKFFEHLDTKPIRTIIISRMIFQTAPFLNYALILSKVRFRDFWWGTLLGLPFPIFLYCVFYEVIFKKLINL